ncbi:MAG TPA: polysaccharide deacetylase family protein [Actinomycetota bacterium]|nr:polysaccharide deacetylase family protein [Actinomycetota bacterium]
MMSRSRYINKTGPLVAALLVLGLLFTSSAPAYGRPPSKPTPSPSPSPTPTTAPDPGGPCTARTPAPGGRTLIVYDASGQYGHLGELFAIQAANLTGHFGTFTAIQTSQYQPGQMFDYALVIYIGSTYGEAVPTSFYSDVLSCRTNVIWMQYQIHNLVEQANDFFGTYGWSPGFFMEPGVTEVRYKGTSFTRRAQGNGDLPSISILDPAKATEVATAVRPDGTTLPWMVRSANLTFIGEVPFTYATEHDRSIIFSDILFDYLAPSTPERHRALVRLEDVGPDANPEILRAIADYLYSRGAPFSVAVYDTYVDPSGVWNNGVPETIRLRDAPEVVSALKYMVSKGGTLIMHGHTHQYRDVPNPYNGVSGDDFEFYMAHVDADNYVRYDGPVPEDSYRWASDRIAAGLREWNAVKLPTPRIFEFPHYAGSDIDYRVVKDKFAARYERSLYFKGLLSGGPIDHKRMVGGTPVDHGFMSGQIFPYVVTDVYGAKVLPENLGNYEPVEYNNHPTRFPAELIDNARRNLAVRDGFASFFYHPFLGWEGLEALKETVEGIQGLGYTFVSPGSLL